MGGSLIAALSAIGHRPSPRFRFGYCASAMIYLSILLKAREYYLAHTLKSSLSLSTATAMATRACVAVSRPFLARRNFSSTRASSADVTHAVSPKAPPEDFHAAWRNTNDDKVIGAGVVGLAIARQLASRQGTSTILLERHDAAGTETSSRNSEVIDSCLIFTFLS